MALPLNETTEQPCAAGLERINGQCVSISSTTSTNALESSSFATVTMIMPPQIAVTQALRTENACPPGTERAQNGRCEVIQVSTSTVVLPESSSFSPVTKITPEVTTTVAVSGKAEKTEDCPQGTVRGQNGQCQPVELSTSTVAVLESSSLSTETIPTTQVMLTTQPMLTNETMPTTETVLSTETMLTTGTMLTTEMMLTTQVTPTTEVNTVAASTEADKLAPCPRNSRRGPNDQCEPVELMTTPQTNDAEVTTEHNEMSGKPINLSQCPEGTKRDDDGSCQEIVRQNRTKTVDPRLFLKKDGSCPYGYKKIKKQCLYIGSKMNVTSLPGDFNTLDRVQPKSGSDESSNLNQLVRTNDDGSCPAGTQHYENGLCIIMNKPLTTAGNSKVTCGDAYELVNGKCIRKSFLQQTQQLESSSESMIGTTEQANIEKFVEPITALYPELSTMISEKLSSMPSPKRKPKQY